MYTHDGECERERDSTRKNCRQIIFHARRAHDFLLEFYHVNVEFSVLNIRLPYARYVVWACAHTHEIGDGKNIEIVPRMLLHNKHIYIFRIQFFRFALNGKKFSVDNSMCCIFCCLLCKQQQQHPKKDVDLIAYRLNSAAAEKKLERILQLTPILPSLRKCSVGDIFTWIVATKGMNKWLL